ncbi:MAG TPA: PAS domain S-box protein [Chloroflexaceae bacterium]|nr:PAS domain S-box protein [Chloroflexaceae bacterium]
MPTRLNILILEDHADEAELLAYELRQAGFSFTWRAAEDREGYLAALAEPPDLILADYTLPGFDALEALRLLRERRLEIPLVVVTGSVSEEAAVACIKQGAADYLLKDRLTRLGPAVSQALDQHQLRAYRRKAERLVHESADLNQAVLSSLTAHLAVLDQAGTIVAVNSAWHRFGQEHGADPTLTGVGVNYLEECRRAAARGCAEAAQALAGIEAVLRGECEHFTFEYVMHCPDEPMWFVLRVTPLAGARGGAVVAHENVSARKAMELALRESEERFRLIYQGAPVGIALADLEGHLLSCNPAFQSILGYGADELCLRPYWAFVHPEDEAAAQGLFGTMAACTCATLSHERRFISRDGRTIWGKLTLTLSRDQQGAPQYGVITLEDITRRKAAYEARSRLAAIVDSSEDAIIGKDLEGTIVAWNRGAERIYGYSAGEIIGRPADVLVPPEELATEAYYRDWVGRGEWLAKYECVRVRKDGRRIDMALTLSPIVDDDGTLIGLSGIGHEISERKRAERALRQQTTFVHLLQRVAVAANQAISLREALQTAVEQICELIGWPLGHVYLAEEGGTGALLSTDIWHGADSEPYRLFRTITEAVPTASLEDLPGRVLLSGRPEWISDLTVAPVVPRARLISNIGVRAGFALPVLVGAEVAAVLEFFAAEAIEPDAELLDVMAHLGAQLGRVVERQRGEDALRASEERYRLIAESTSDVITLTDSAGRYVYISPSVGPLMGYEPARIVGTSIFDLVHPDNHAAIVGLLAGAGRPEGGRLTMRVRHADGHYRWFETHRTTLTQQKVNYILGVSRDVTERLEAELAIRRSEERYRTLFETMSQGVVYQNAEGAITEANPAAERILGLSLAQMQGRTSMDPRWRTIHEDGSPFPGDTHPSMVALRTGVELKNEVMGVYNPADGNYRWISVSAVPQFRPGEERPFQVYATFEDITELKLAEAALIEERALLARRVEERTADLSAANAQLARAARLKDEFLASMSHELRTPLNAVLGLSEALREHTYGPVSSEQSQSLELIEESGRHLLALINDILDLAKIGADKVELELEPVAVRQLCQACARMMRQEALKKRLDLELSLATAPRFVRADARRLKQILVNLLSNAVKFTPEGGAIGLEVVASEEDQLVRFTVWDRGIGIAADQIQRLFKPFVQLDSRLARQYQGTGLGLALVYRLAELHGGSVAVASEPGTGSRFTITLPWHGDEVSCEPPQIEACGALTPRTALVVEDSPTAAEQLARYLAELRIEVLAVARGGEAMARAVELRPDLIFLDILLPDTSGWEVLEQLKADPRTAAAPVIITSVVDDHERGAALGAAARLVKPCSRADLQDVLARLHMRPPPAPAPRSAAPDGVPTILLAEDNEANIRTVSDYLAGIGHHVVVARNGAEAVARAREVHPALILMDIQMPGMDGIEATRRIRADADLAPVPILALTALAMPGDRERCIEAGASDYISKPVSLRALARAIGAYLRPAAGAPRSAP